MASFVYTGIYLLFVFEVHVLKLFLPSWLCTFSVSGDHNFGFYLATCYWNHHFHLQRKGTTDNLYVMSLLFNVFS